MLLMPERKIYHHMTNNDSTELAIVILNWNGSKMMRKYLPSVLEHSGNAEIIVADNASTDDSLAMLANEFPTVRTIVLDKNWGFADGYNKALAQVKAEYYLLLNSDVRVEKGWLDAMMDYMRKNNDVAACQPKLLSDVSPPFLNTPEPAAVSLTGTVTLTAGGVCSAKQKQTADNTIPLWKCCGPQEPVF